MSIFSKTPLLDLVDPCAPPAFAEPAADQPSKITDLEIQVDLSTVPPKLHAAFLLPNLPSRNPVTMALTVQPDRGADTSGLRSDYTLHCVCPKTLAATREKLSGQRAAARIQRVLGTSRNLADLVGWLSAQGWYT